MLKMACHAHIVSAIIINPFFFSAPILKEVSSRKQIYITKRYFRHMNCFPPLYFAKTVYIKELSHILPFNG